MSDVPFEAVCRAFQEIHHRRKELEVSGIYNESASECRINLRHLQVIVARFAYIVAHFPEHKFRIKLLVICEMSYDFVCGECRRLMLLFSLSFLCSLESECKKNKKSWVWSLFLY
jgi:hypothetical protein